MDYLLWYSGTVHAFPCTARFYHCKKNRPFFGGCVCAFLALIIFSAVYTYFDIIPDQQQVAEVIGNLPNYYLPVIILGPALLVPLIEEILFRCFLYKSLSMKMGKIPAMLITSAIFALVHFEPHSMPQLFVLGFIFNVVYEKSGSLATAVGIHAVNNTLAIVSLLIIQPTLELQPQEETPIVQEAPAKGKSPSNHEI